MRLLKRVRVEEARTFPESAVLQLQGYGLRARCDTEVDTNDAMRLLKRAWVEEARTFQESAVLQLQGYGLRARGCHTEVSGGVRGRCEDACWYVVAYQRSPVTQTLSHDSIASCFLPLPPRCHWQSSAFFARSQSLGDSQARVRERGRLYSRRRSTSTRLWLGWQRMAHGNRHQ